MNDPMVARLTGLVGEMASVASQVGEDADRIDVITVLERLKAAAAAAQLSVVADFAASQEASNRALGVEARAARRGVPEQVGLARKVAPATAARQVSQANALRDDLPDTFALLANGEISEWVATIVVTETSHLAAEDRRLVDKQLATELPELSPRRAQARARALGYEIDPQGAVKRAGNARKDRRVSMRPAPDTMAMLSALLPCEQGVAAWAALKRHADSVIATGDDDGRSRDQIMADTLVERLTGQATAADVAAEIGLIMTDSALFDGDTEPADMTDYGPIPADTARDIARRAANAGDASADEDAGSADQHDTGDHDSAGDHDSDDYGHSRDRSASGNGGDSDDSGDNGVEPEPGDSHDGTAVRGDSEDAAGQDRSAADEAAADGDSGADGGAGAHIPTSDRAAETARLWLRRLFTDPATGVIIDCDPRRRRFTGTLAKLLIYRDQRCRSPYCDAPIRHLDHIRSAAQGGPTTSTNGRGLCERCNYADEMPGWKATVINPDSHTVETTTPTGHRYRSQPPAAPGTRRPRGPT